MEGLAPVMGFMGIGDFALKFEAKFWVERRNIAYDKKVEATKEIYNGLRKAKIGIPFPTHTVYVKK